jgi:hypothetical protein
MFKKGAVKLTLAITLLALAGHTLRAQSTGSTPTTSGSTTSGSNIVSGGDPEPPEPDVIQIILTVLQLA